MIALNVEHLEHNVQLREQPHLKTEMAVFLANSEMATPQKHEPKSMKEILIKMGLLIPDKNQSKTQTNFTNKA